MFAEVADVASRVKPAVMFAQAARLDTRAWSGLPVVPDRARQLNESVAAARLSLDDRRDHAGDTLTLETP